MRDNDNKTDNRIAGNSSADASANAELQRRHAMWGVEAKALRQGELCMDGLRNKLIDMLIKYLLDRVNFFVFYREGARGKYTNKFEPDARTYDKSFEKLNGQGLLQAIRLFEEIALYEKATEKCATGPYEWLRVKMNKIEVSDPLRDKELTLHRVDTLWKAIRALSTQELIDQCQSATAATTDNMELYKKMTDVLQTALEAIHGQHAQYATRHHVHIPGSRFFGGGSLFQSGAENAVLAALKEVKRVRGERGKLFSSHENEKLKYDEFVNKAKL